MAAYLSGIPIQPDFQSIISMIPVYVLIGPLSEEPGWRGYALPHLLEKSNALKAGLITGILWALWHLPAYIISGTPQEAANPFEAFLGFILIALGMNLLQAWVFIRTKGSALLAGILFHLSYNISMTLSGDPHLWLGFLFLLVAAAVFARPQNRSFIGRLEPASE
jgi:membrane protease YdiL (CAAX protease family)